MEVGKKRYLLEKFKDCMYAADVNTLSDVLNEADDSAFESLNAVKTKSSTAALLLSMFLGGFSAGRFYLGDYLYAILKIIAVFAISLISGFLGVIVLVIGLLIILAWYIADIVLCYQRAKKLNGEKVLSIARAYKTAAAK